MRWVALLVLIVGCYKEHSFHDCELSCTNELGCPSGLTCLAGMCRESGHTGACTGGGGDGMVDSPTDGLFADSDGDTVPDAQDNCPNKANRDQADEDRDLIGDVCDICPISANTRDTDNDGVGDDCDFDNSNQDFILLFQPFNTAPGSEMMPFGPSTITYQGGQAAVSAMQGPAGLTWDSGNALAATIFTRVTITQRYATPNMAGTLDHSDTTAVGTGCANYTNASGGAVFTVVDVATQSAVGSAPGSAFSLNQPYNISQQRVNGTAKCVRDTQFQVMAPLASGGTRWGLYLSNVDATFDYVMVVGH
jgi:hypothetical protein